MTPELEALASEIAVAAIAAEHGPQRYAEQARDGNWPIYRCARAAALVALRTPTQNHKGPKP